MIALDAIEKSAKEKEKRIRRRTCNRGFIYGHLAESPQALQPAMKEAQARVAWALLFLFFQNQADQRSCSLAAYSSRRASSASSARSLRNAKNPFDWPMKSPLAVRNLAAPIAAPFVRVGRTIEHVGNCRLRNTVGSGMIRLVWKSSPPKGAALRFGNTSVGSLGSVKAGALPALSCHV